MIAITARETERGRYVFTHDEPQISVEQVRTENARAMADVETLARRVWRLRAELGR